MDAVPDSTGALGFMAQSAAHYSDLFPSVHLEYGFGGALSHGFVVAWQTLTDYVRSLRFLFTKSGASQVGSLVTFGSIFDAGWDWEVFWRNTAFFSLILAFMNLLPIPALDGGHVMFTLYELAGVVTNLVAGLGGGLLQKVNRDTLHCAIKASYAKVDGNERPIRKETKGKTSKRPMKGFQKISFDDTGAATAQAPSGRRSPPCGLAAHGNDPSRRWTRPAHARTAPGQNCH